MYGTQSFERATAFLAIVLLCACAHPTYAQTQLIRSTLSNAGGIATNASFQVTTVVGLPVVGRAMGLQAGFLFSL